MATAVVTAAVAGAPLFTVPLNLKGIIDSVVTDNEGASGQIQFTVQDTFTEDISVTPGGGGTAAPAARVANPLTWSVPQTETDVLDKNVLTGVGILGVAVLLASATDAGAVVTVQYHFE